MEKIFKFIRRRIRRWRYRRLYNHLFKFYALRTDGAIAAVENADYAFENLTGWKWIDWLLWEYYGVKPSSKSHSD